jgi:hypothetical protein
MEGMRRPRAADPRVVLLVDQLDRAFRGPSWHGTALRGTLRGLSPKDALWRPGRDRNCAWDLLLHAAYWKYIVRRRLTGDQRGSFPREGANFPRLPAPADAAAWRSDLALLDEQHELLRTAVLALDPALLPSKRGSWRIVDYVTGAAAHDLYHAGQVNLLKRLRPGGKRRARVESRAAAST